MLWCCCKKEEQVVVQSLFLPTPWVTNPFLVPIHHDPLEAHVTPGGQAQLSRIYNVFTPPFETSFLGGITYVFNNIPSTVVTAVLTMRATQFFWTGTGSDLNIHTWINPDPSLLDPPWAANQIIEIPRSELSTPVHWELSSVNFGASSDHDTPDIADIINQAIAASLFGWSSSNFIAIHIAVPDIPESVGERRTNYAELRIA